MLQECCKPQHAGTAAAPSVLDTVRARFSAILRKDVGYLVRTTTPAFHAFHYGGEPGASLAKLTDDLTSTCDHYEYSALKVREVRRAVWAVCGLWVVAGSVNGDQLTARHTHRRRLC
jgi:uncharacterized protein YchJ